MNRTLGALLSILAFTACSPGEPTPSAGAATTVAQPSPKIVPEEEAPRVVFFGDSLTAGYGLDTDQAFPALVGRRLAEQGIEVVVVNAGVSGDTTAGGLTRIEWVLRQRPQLVVVELGANDGLRGLSPDMTETNLRQIIAQCREAGAEVVLAGMKLPPNYGEDYITRFEAIFPRLAEELDLPYIPFLLDGVAGRPGLNLPDGIHPTPEGHEIVADNVVPVVIDTLNEPAVEDS